METLFILNEVITNGMSYSIISVIPLLSVLCGISVIVTKNPIVSVLFLIGLFTSMASYIMALGMNFIGLSYILVYVGAVSILFLFILMLINVRISELVTENNNSVPLAILIIALVSINQFSPNVTSMPAMMIRTTDFKLERDINIQESFFSDNYLDNILTATSSCWDGKLSETSHITTIGNIIYTNYPMWLILTSIILLLAMVGSILITIKQ